MEESEIRKKIEELSEGLGWYQAIDLKNGIKTPCTKVWGSETDHPRSRWNAIAHGFPQSFTNKSVLDLGCNAGYFSFVAADRGASYICGIDKSEHYIRQARFCNEVRGDNIDFRLGDVLDITSMKQNFDITMCIGILYHVQDLWGAIRAIGRVTKELAIIETAIRNDSDREPLIYYAGADPKLAGTWHPNLCALEKMFLTAGFSRTERLFKEGGRGGIMALK